MFETQKLVRIASRDNNANRPFLLVNPLQAKHVPTSPLEAVSMMNELADTLKQEALGKCVVVAFAETATAIGAVIAASLGDDCFYVHTTRESLPSECELISFREEHSHAVDQVLSVDRLKDHLSDADCIIFVDDEFSTGRTLSNLIDSIRKRFDINNAKLFALSVVNRIPPDMEKRFRHDDVEFRYLLRLDADELIHQVEKNTYPVLPVPDSASIGNENTRIEWLPGILPDDPRRGFNSLGAVWHSFEKLALIIDEMIASTNSEAKRILVLGTEECMFPALFTACELEKVKAERQVLCHSTTRSPIRVSQAPGYPISNGVSLRSFYDSARQTYLYNLRAYDVAVVITDASKSSCGCGFSDLARALMFYGTPIVLGFGI